MAQIPLKRRRLLARGFGRQHFGLSNRNFWNLGNRATLTTALAGANNDITFLSRRTGTVGNSVTVALVVSGANTPLSVSVSTEAITVNVATNGSSAATSTADQVIDAVNRSLTAGPKVWAQRAPANDGTGVVAALGATNLTGAT